MMLIYMRNADGAVMPVYDEATKEFNEKNGWEVFDYVKDHAEKLAIKQGKAVADEANVHSITRKPGRPRKES